MWKLIVECGPEDFEDGAISTYLGRIPVSDVVEATSRILTYLYPDKLTAQEAKRRLKRRLKGRTHCEIVPT